MYVEDVLNDSITDVNYEQEGKVKVTLTLTDEQVIFLVNFMCDSVDELNDMWVKVKIQFQFWYTERCGPCEWTVSRGEALDEPLSRVQFFQNKSNIYRYMIIQMKLKNT